MLQHTHSPRRCWVVVKSGFPSSMAWPVIPETKTANTGAPRAAAGLGWTGGRLGASWPAWPFQGVGGSWCGGWISDNNQKEKKNRSQRRCTELQLACEPSSISIHKEDKSVPSSWDSFREFGQNSDRMVYAEITQLLRHTPTSSLPLP